MLLLKGRKDIFPIFLDNIWIDINKGVSKDQSLAPSVLIPRKLQLAIHDWLIRYGGQKDVSSQEGTKLKK